MPPDTGEASFPPYIFQGAVLGILTIVGLIGAGGRILDAFTDPWIANLSDRSTSKLGKRKLFMLIGALPLALFSFLVFYPISPNNIAMNSGWLVLVITLFYLSFTIYAIPYAALLSELGHQAEDRMLISTMISVTWAVGFFIGNTIFVLQGYFEQTVSPTLAFQYSAAIFSGIAFVCLLFPVFFVDERKYCAQKTTNTGVLESIGKVLENSNFRNFVFSDLTYWISLTIIQSGMVYYVTVLLELDKEYTTFFMGGAFLLSIFVFYAVVNIAVAKLGKKKVVSFGFIIFAITFLIALFLGNLPVSKEIQLIVMGILAAMPMAIFGIVPNAIIADIVHHHEQTTGEQLAGMFFAFRTLMMKFGVTIGVILFPSFLLMGRSIDNDFGIRFSGFAALVFCLIGFLLFQRFKEVGVSEE